MCHDWEPRLRGRSALRLLKLPGLVGECDVLLLKSSVGCKRCGWRSLTCSKERVRDSFAERTASTTGLESSKAYADQR